MASSSHETRITAVTLSEGGDLEARLASLEAKVVALEGQLSARVAQPSVTLPRHLTSSPGAVQPPPPPPPVGAQPLREPSPEELASAVTPASRIPNWTEQITTEVALKWAGLGLVFLAATFLVSTAVTRGWVGPELQLAGAVALGLVLVTLGIRARGSLPRWSVPLALAGIAVLFTSSGAASEWLDLGGTGTGTLAACAVTVLALALARNYSWLAMALLALFAILVVTLWLDAPDEYGIAATIAFTFLLVIVFHLVAVDQHWPILYLATAFTLMLVQLAGAFEDEAPGPVQTFVIGSAIAHWLVPVALERQGPSTQLSRLAGRATLAIPAWLFMTTVVLHNLSTNQAIGIAAAVSVAAVASALALRPHVGQWLWAAQILAGAVAVSVGFAYWLEGSTLLGALAAQAAVMLVMATRIDDQWFWWQSVVTAILVSIVAFGLTLDALDNDATWGADLVHFFVFMVALGIGWANRTTDIGRMIGGGAYAAMFVWVASVCIHFGQGQLIISAIWATIGLVVVVVALGRRNMLVARVGLLTLALVVAKLLTVDLAEIDTFWRAGLFFVIGVGFLWLSYSVPGLLGRKDEQPPDSP